MPYEQKNNPFKKLMSNITSGLNIKAPNVKKEMDWKHGLGEFASKETRRKPGESKFQYDVRMREKTSRLAKEQKSKSSMPDPKTEIKGLQGQPPLWAQSDPLGISSNPNDLTDKSKVQNYGIVPGMSFSEAFAQAGKMGATRTSPPFQWTDPKTGNVGSFVYELASESSDFNSGDKSETVPSHVLQVPAFADLTYEQYIKDSTSYLKGAENWLKQNK